MLLILLFKINWFWQSMQQFVRLMVVWFQWYLQLILVLYRCFGFGWLLVVDFIKLLWLGLWLAMVKEVKVFEWLLIWQNRFVFGLKKFSVFVCFMLLFCWLKLRNLQFICWYCRLRQVCSLLSSLQLNLVQMLKFVLVVLFWQYWKFFLLFEVYFVQMIFLKWLLKQWWELLLRVVFSWLLLLMQLRLYMFL